MSKPIQATYEAFKTAANQLENEGERISVRSVRAKIGGSNSKLMECLRQWKSEKQLVDEIDEFISEPFRQALLAERGRAVKQTRERLEKQLTDEKNSTQETLILLVETEKMCAQHGERIKALEANYQKTVLNFEQQVAGLKARLKDEESREESLMQQLERLRTGKHQAEVESAVAKSHYEALKKQLNIYEDKELQR